MRSRKLLQVLALLTVTLSLCLAATPLSAAVQAKVAGRLTNICPGRDCTFGEWRAKADVAVYTAKDASSEVVFHVLKGESVTGLSSELVIVKAGTCVATKPVQAYEIGSKTPVSLKAKDRITALYFSAEGYVVGNFQKKRIEACCVGEEAELTCKTEPVNELWLKVKSKSGVVGWTNARDKFSGTFE